jgi:hypothetical protein
MSHPAPPLLRLDEDTVLSAHVLDQGVWVPRVLVPVLRGPSADGGVAYGVGDREWTYQPPPTPDPHAGEVDWSQARQEYSPHTAVGGVIRQVGMGAILTSATARHQCGPCGAAGPWVVEWVTGAVHHTARLECRTCWQAETRHPDWVQEMVRRLQPQTLPDSSFVDLGGY